MNLVIGIVSYLPENNEAREQRKTLITNLVKKCNEVFPKIPVWVIAQNWKDFSVENATIFAFDKLGINGARQKLKDKFIGSVYDHLIMFDDDCILTMDEIDAKLYLQELSENSGKACSFISRSLKLFSIPKSLFMSVPSFINNVYSDKYNADELVVYNTIPKEKMHFLKYPYRQSKIAILNPEAISTSYTDKRLQYLK